MVSHCCFKKLYINAFPHRLTVTLSRELAIKTTSHQEGLHDLTIECGFPNIPKFLVNVLAFIYSPNFSFYNGSQSYVSSEALAQLLAAFISTSCSHSQELAIKVTGTVTLPKDFNQSVVCPMPLAICSSSLQCKSLKWSGLSGEVCNWLLSLKSLALESLFLECYQCSLEE